MKEEIILVTGASRGIGEAIAKFYARRKFFVLLTARTETDLARVKKDILQGGGKAEYIVCDLSNPENAMNLATRIYSSYGWIDRIVLNAGMSANSEFHKISADRFLLELNTNYIAPLAFLKVCLEQMMKKKEGKIVTISSIAGTLPFPGNASYAASKAALISISNTMHIELKKHNIYIGTVLPGLTRTEMTREYESYLLPFASPEEIADTVEEAFRSERPIVIPGILNNFLTNLYKYFPDPINGVLGLFSNLLIPGESKL